MIKPYFLYFVVQKQPSKKYIYLSLCASETIPQLPSPLFGAVLPKRISDFVLILN